MGRQLSKKINRLIEAYLSREQQHFEIGEKVKVDRTVSSVSFFYEKVRNAVDYREDHLFRRAAIERILTRRLMLGMRDETQLANLLIKELIQAGYCHNDEISEWALEKIVAKLKWYIGFLKKIEFFSLNLRQKLIGVASVDIDEELSTRTKEEALVDVFYVMLEDEFKKAGLASNQDWNEEYLYINIQRIFLKSDKQTIYFYLLKNYLPDWGKIDIDSELISDFSDLIGLIAKNIKSASRDKFTSKYIKKNLATFLVTRHIFANKMLTPEDFLDEDKVMQAVKESASQLYAFNHQALKRGIIKVIIFIFLTKTVFAAAIEYPYDLYFIHHPNWMALTINILFPITLLLFLGFWVKIPSEENSGRIFNALKKVIYEDNSLLFPELIKKSKPRFPKWLTNILYGITYLISFGLVAWLLYILHFNIASAFIFFFFLSLVSFLAYRLQAGIRELKASGAREGIIWALGDLFTLPFLKIGQVLSDQVAKINVWLYILDFLFEAPLKLILEVIESWAVYIREKKEELL